MRLVVDGNDGTGKSTLVRLLGEQNIVAADRGLPTKMTDDPSIAPKPDEFYIILDAPVEVCQQRLRLAGQNLGEQYHTVEDLTWYRQRFAEVATRLDQCVILDSSSTPQRVLDACIAKLRERGLIT